MTFRRLKEVKAQLSRIAGSTGIDPSGSAVIELVNRAQEELINEGEWPGITDRYRATILDGWFTLPDEFVSVKFISTDSNKQPVKGEWFEFMDYGPGVQDQDAKSLSHGALDRGVSTVFANIPQTDGPWRLKVRSDRQEDGDLSVWIKGWDDRGKWLIDNRTDEEGLRINLPPSRITWGASDQPMSKIEERPGGVILPEGRKGEITLSAWNGTYDVILAQYKVGIELPQFRRYFIPGLTTDTEHTIIVKASKRFRPVKKDDDVLQMSNMPALELMILALRSKDNAKVEEYFNYKQLAVEELRKEAKRYHDEEPHVAIRASVDFGYGFPGVK